MLEQYCMVMIPLLGLLVGSLANVLIYRVPRGEDWIFKPSHCPHCSNRLKWYELIPLFSWFFLGGRCSYCHNSISIIYPAVELSNALLWFSCFKVLGLDPFLPVALVLMSALLVMAVIDGQTKQIPDGIHLFLLGVGIMWNAYAGFMGYDIWWENLIGFFAVSVPLFLIAILSHGGMGGGDIKLTAVCGFIIGWKLILLSLALASIIGTILMLPRYLIKKDEVSRVVPFGPFLAVGIFIAVCFGWHLLELYLTHYFSA